MVRRRSLAVVAALLAVGAIAAALVGRPGLFDTRPAPASAGASTIAVATPTPFLTAPPTASASPTPVPTPRPVISILDRTGIQDRLQATLDRDRTTLAAPGIVATVLFADGRTWSGTAGVADLASGRALTIDTPFSIASVSKTFLAAEVLALVNAGKLRLTDSAVRFLPEVLVGGRRLDPRITVRELLDHTSGLRDYLVDRRLGVAVEAAPRRVWTPAQALAYAGKPLAAPGTGYHYANTNYVVLGLIVERVTGRTLAQEYRTRFFDPLGMTRSFCQVAEAPIARMPTAYRYASAKLDAVPADVTDGTGVRPFTAITSAAGAAGSVAASAPDLATWARALYGGSVLPPGAVEEMISDATTTATLKPAYPYGLGVQVLPVDGRLSYGHSGRLVGARAAMRWFPDLGLAIVVLTNESRFDPGVVVRDLLAVVAPREDWMVFPAR